MKLAAVVLAVVISCGVARADGVTTVFDFSVTQCATCANLLSLSGEITATAIPDGTWNEWEIDSLSGEFDGESISTPVPGLGTTSGSDIGEIFQVNGSGDFLPEALFLANGQIITWEWFSGDVPGTELVQVLFPDGSTELVSETIVDPTGVPEPGVLPLLLAALISLIIFRDYRLRKEQ